MVAVVGKLRKLHNDGKVRVTEALSKRPCCPLLDHPQRFSGRLSLSGARGGLLSLPFVVSKPGAFNQGPKQIELRLARFFSSYDANIRLRNIVGDNHSTFVLDWDQARSRTPFAHLFLVLRYLSTRQVRRHKSRRCRSRPTG